MFKIDSNQVIRITKGDFAQVPLFCNIGTAYEPVRYEFNPGSLELICETLTCTGDILTFRQKAEDSDIYTFIYRANDDSWYYQGQSVDLSEWGISYTGTPVNTTTIRAYYTKDDGCFVDFYINEINSDAEDYLLKLTFYSYKDCYFDLETGKPNGDILITFDEHTFDELEAGEYRYYIKATTLYRPMTQDEPIYVETTIHNKTPIFIIDNDYGINYRW